MPIEASFMALLRSAILYMDHIIFSPVSRVGRSMSSLPRTFFG